MGKKTRVLSQNKYFEDLKEGLSAAIKYETGEFDLKTIPIREQWLFKNEKALNSVLLGLRQAREGKFVEKPSYRKKKVRKK